MVDSVFIYQSQEGQRQGLNRQIPDCRSRQYRYEDPLFPTIFPGGAVAEVDVVVKAVPSFVRRQVASLSSDRREFLPFRAG